MKNICTLCKKEIQPTQSKGMLGLEGMQKVVHESCRKKRIKDK